MDTYEKIEGNIVYNDEILEDADFQSFEFLWGVYAKDKNNLFIDWELIDFIDWIDLWTLVYIWEDIIKDINNVYHDASIIKWADATTFVKIYDIPSDSLDIDEPKWYYFKDKYNIYLKFDDWFGKMPKLDVTDFKIYNYCYFFNNWKIYFAENWIEALDSWVLLVKDVDLSTFEAIEWHYSKDKNNVFYKNTPIEWSDPDSLVIINYYYCKDNNYVYHKWIKKTFDSPSFKILNDKYISDKNWVYFNWILTNIFDVNTFKVLPDLYVKDKDGVFHNWTQILWCDSASFITLWCSYAKDYKNVYYGWELMSYVDYPSFQVTWNWRAKDRYNEYDWEKIIWWKNKNPNSSFFWRLLKWIWK